MSGAQPGPQPGKFYVVKVGSADWTSGSGVGELNLLSLTLSNVPLVGILMLVIMMQHLYLINLKLPFQFKS